MYLNLQRLFLLPLFFLGGFLAAQVAGGVEVLVGQSLRFRNTSVEASEFYWDFGDGTVSREKHPVHQFSEPGIYQVRLEAERGNCEAVTTQEVVVLPKTSENLSGVNVFPVPARETATLALPESFSGEAQIRVLDQLGRTIFEQEVFQEAGESLQIPIQVTEWAAGNYWVEIKSSTDKQVLTLLKQ